MDKENMDEEDRQREDRILKLRQEQERLKSIEEEQKKGLINWKPSKTEWKKN